MLYNVSGLPWVWPDDYRQYERYALQIARPILLYNVETWCLMEEKKRKLCVFEMLVLCRISSLSLRDRRHNESIKEELGMDADVVQLVQ